jgi:hypothetical protein
MPLKLPSNLTYNDLNGVEAREALVDWFRQLLDSHPPFGQQHLTLPMAKISLDLTVSVDSYIGGSVPIESPAESMDIHAAVTLDNNLTNLANPANPTNLISEMVERAAPMSPAPARASARRTAVINAAPIPGGSPPDQIRERHNLPIPRPGYGDRETGRHLFIGDVEVSVSPSRLPGLDGRATEMFDMRDVSHSNRTDPEPDNTNRIIDPSDNLPSGGRQGIVADGYVFASEITQTAPSRQEILVDKGKIKLDMSGEGIDHAGIHVTAGTHVSSVKTLGDQGGQPYESVNGVYDAGPAGLMRPGRSGGGLYSDGRPRISFGNNNRG